MSERIDLLGCPFDSITENEAVELVFLPDVGGEGDDLGVVRLFQPRQDDGGIETAGIGKHDFRFGHRECGPPCR